MEISAIKHFCSKKYRDSSNPLAVVITVQAVALELWKYINLAIERLHTRDNQNEQIQNLLKKLIHEKLCVKDIILYKLQTKRVP